jgi:cystathionine gamma-lyase
MTDWKFATKAIHVGQAADPTTGATILPIHLSTTFTQEAIGQDKGFDYSRAGNPTRAAYEACLASLEGAAYALAFGSGCAASAAVIELLQTGDEVVASAEVYGGTYRLFEQVMSRHGITFHWVMGTDPAAFAAAMTKRTKLVWIETPTNPCLSILDIQTIARHAKQTGALLAVDNTFATPYFQNPLSIGADLVVHSTTKYIGGHSDVVGGAIMLDDTALHERLAFIQKSVGGVPSPFDCWLTLRGLKTLALRMERHQKSAAKIARWLTHQSAIERVYYPGLTDHPGHDVAIHQMRGFPGMVSFALRGGRAAVDRVVSKLRLFSLAESLGGVESLCCYPAQMTHAAVPQADREAMGITEGLLRLSIGIEDVDDLIAELDSALA